MPLRGSSTFVTMAPNKNSRGFTVLKVTPELLFKIALWFPNVQILYFSGKTPWREKNEGVGMEVDLSARPMDTTMGQLAALVPPFLQRGAAGQVKADTVHSGSFPPRRQCPGEPDKL